MNNLEFQQAVFTLSSEYLQLFESEADARKIGIWVESIPNRFPKFKIGDLLAKVKEAINLEEG